MQTNDVTPNDAPPAKRRRPLGVRIVIWAVSAVVAVALLISAGVFVYIHFIKSDAPKKLSISDVTLPAGSTPSHASGNVYTVTSDSVVGYRVVEVLFGQDTEGVGRTNSVTGTITLDDTNVTAATFSVDMTTVRSDEDNRDRQFQNNIMETRKFPTATFTLTAPIALGSIPADGTSITASATGDLTLHGVTKAVTFDVSAKKSGASIAIVGSIPITFADYSIANPSNTAATTQDHGLLEFQIVATAS